MKKQLFIKNAILLTATTLITRSIGVWFSVYISNKIGAQGMGLLSLIITVYAFSATFATSGITLTVTRIVTDSLAKEKPGEAKYAVKKCIIFGFILSSAVALIMFFNAEFISIAWLSDIRCVLSLKILAVSLPFMAFSACLRGYFYARRTAIKTASEQLLEQVIEIVVFVIIVSVLLPYGIEYGCVAVVIGTTVAEIFSCAYSGILYAFDIRKIKEKSKRTRGFLKKVLSIGIPVTLSSCLRSGLSMLENVLIPYGLRKNGSSSDKALSKYGEIIGMAMPIITFPNVFLFCFSQLMIPEMSEAKISSRKNNIAYMAGRIFRFSLLFALPVSCGFFFFGPQLGVLIYNNAQIGFYIQILAPIVPFLYLDKVVDGMLKGLNEQLHYLMYNIIDSVLRVTLTFFLLPVLGIKGVVIVMYASALLNSGLSIARLLKVANVKVDVLNWFIKPVIFSLISGFLVGYVVLDTLIAETIARIILFLFVYILLMAMFKGVKREEVSWFAHLFKK